MVIRSRQRRRAEAESPENPDIGHSGISGAADAAPALVAHEGNAEECETGSILMAWK